MKLTWHAWAKAGMFCAVGVMCALFVVNTLSVPVRGATTGYLAQFSSVEGLNVGNPVLMDGVRIGRVSSIRFADNGNGTARADVGLQLTSRLTLSADVTAAVRYGDMLGARYVALSDPSGGIITVSTGDKPKRLASGAVIPSLTGPEVERLVADGTISGGMIPKVENCLHAARLGVAAQIIDGRREGALLSYDGSGTIITP